MIVQYMESHSLFARGQKCQLGPQGKQKFNHLLEELTEILNNMEGAKKTPKDWWIVSTEHIFCNKYYHGK